jgi:hypothetical protein
MGTETIRLNSKTGQHIVKAVPVDSILKCTKTSHQDVYVHALTQTHQSTLQPGDSMLVERSTLTIWVFRKLGGNEEFWAELELASV